ncbi:AbrB/MazE/SpoVT family DNA-binding domain-containing protein [Candidatus Parcubacteria bacterium]|nr:MAG: AbrB/MazE/SpoVT family DNA-binding domain-containing protein [Candidatus Parcubacteria bacterium]
MTQKVLKVGSSAAVTIPKRTLEELGLKVGDRVSVEINKKQASVVIKPHKTVDRETLDWTRKFIERYRPALEALAKR